MKTTLASLLSFFSTIAFAFQAQAGVATEWQLNFQEAATPVMEDITSLHTDLLYLITVITIFVLLLLTYACVRYSRKNNPKPSRFTHNNVLEIVWTSIPIIILVIVAIPSYKLVYKVDVTPPADMTLKVVGNSWFWTYEYPDHGDITFDSNIIWDKDLRNANLEAAGDWLIETSAEERKRLLETDTRVVVPVDTTVRVLVTSADVIHAWAVPAFGVKMDAVPGRINETWFRATKEGLYYGQCSELCGKFHGFMPIAIEVVSKDAFNRWVNKQVASNDAPITVAQQ